MLFSFAEIEQIDFDRDETPTNIINSWRSNATKNEINHIITSGLYCICFTSIDQWFLVFMYTVYLKMYKGMENVPQPVMFMIFTTFFNGLWSKPSPENETTIGDFFINSKDSVPVQFMHQTGSYYYAYAPELDAKMIRLPYSVRHFFFDWFTEVHSIFFLFLFVFRKTNFPWPLSFQTVEMAWINSFHASIAQYFIVINFCWKKPRWNCPYRNSTS